MAGMARRLAVLMLLLVVLTAPRVAAVTKADVLRARKAAIQAEATKIMNLEKQLERAKVDHLNGVQQHGHLYGWDQLDPEGVGARAGLENAAVPRVRLPKGYTEETVRQRLGVGADRGVGGSMRSAARTAAADELDGSSTQITDLLLFIVIFVVFYHGFLLFTKKREQVQRVAALAYAEVEAWSTTHAPAVWAVVLRLAGHAETARVAVATAWAEVPNALRVARDTVARTAMGSKSAEERIKETRASIAAAKASMEAQKRVEQAQRAAEAGLSPEELEGLSRKERVDLLRGQLASPK